MNKTLFQSFLLSALMLLNAPAFAYQFVDWASLPTFEVNEWNQANGQAWQPAALATTNVDEMMQDFKYVYLGNLREAKGTLYDLKVNAASPDVPYFYHQMLELLAEFDESNDFIQQLSTEENITDSDARLKYLYDWLHQLSSSLRQLSFRAKVYGHGTDLNGMKEALNRLLEEWKEQNDYLDEKLEDIREDYPELYRSLSWRGKVNLEQIQSLTARSSEIASVEDYNELWMQAEAVGFEVRSCIAGYNTPDRDVAEGDLMGEFRRMNANMYEECLKYAGDVLTKEVDKFASTEAPHFYHRMRTIIARLDEIYRANLNRQVSSKEEIREREIKYIDYVARLVEFRQLVDYYTQGVDLDGMKTELEQVIDDLRNRIEDFLKNTEEISQSNPALQNEVKDMVVLWEAKCQESAQVIDGITSVEDYNKTRMEFEALGIDIKMDIQRLDELFRIVQTDDPEIMINSLKRQHQDLNEYLNLVYAELVAAATQEQAPELYNDINIYEAVLYKVGTLISQIEAESDGEAAKEGFLDCQDNLNEVARRLEEMRQQIRELSNGSDDALTAAKKELQGRCDELKMFAATLYKTLEAKATREQAPELYAELEDCYTMLSDISYHISEITSLDDAKQLRAALDNVAMKLTGLKSLIDALTVEHEYVDLGLPSGTLWATCNVGANSPEEYGDYFAWGETEPKSNYSWETYKYSEETQFDLTKYCVQSHYSYSDALIDHLTDLLPEDDAATVNWGSDWQMPSKVQILELFNEEYTTSEWTQQNGVNGRLITSKSNGKSIFLPAAGDYFYDESDVEGDLGYYWSRSLNTDESCSAYSLSFGKWHINYVGRWRSSGQSVRPVRYKEPVWVSSIVLSETSLRMEVGTYRSLTSTFEPANADNSYRAWKSSDPNVATVNGGEVRALSAGTCIITCYATDGGGAKAECQLTVFDPDAHDFVDLGLPSGTLWATCNVGAENPEDYGDYFRWGETITKDIYDNNIPECHVKELDAAHDAATVNWGSCWQMPSIEQFGELINSDYTTTEWTTVNGVNGRKITSNINGNSIFLPAAGWYYYDSVENVGSKGWYWSRSHGNPSGYIACLSFNSNDINDTSLIFYSMGQSVRPVRKKEVYAELAEETGTMTYYYDNLRTSRSGVTEKFDPVNRFDRPSHIFSYKVLKGVIDPSMKEANLTSTSFMFYDCYWMTSIEGLENLNTDNVTEMDHMFLYCSKLKSLDLSSFNTSNVTRMDYMFEACSSLQIIDLTSFDVTNVTDMMYMFESCSELTTICCFGDWSTSDAESYGMFRDCDKLVGGKGTPYNYAFTDKTYARPDGGTGSPGYFTADTMTGIKAIDNGQQSTDGSIYKQGSTIVNLAGQRIGKMQKGIYIVNGRKVAF